LDEGELRRAFGAFCELLLTEVNAVDIKLADRLASTVNELRDCGLAMERRGTR
jgi:hypothetical protein